MIILMLILIKQNKTYLECQTYTEVYELKRERERMEKILSFQAIKLQSKKTICTIY